MSALDRATDKARSRDAMRNGNANAGETQLTKNEATEVALAGDLKTEMMASPADIAARIKAGAWEAAPQILKIEEGDTVIGFLEGYGPPAEIMDTNTRETKYVNTYVLRSLSGSNARVSILGSAQLDRKLPPFFGGECSISRVGTIDTKAGRRVTEYVVAGPVLVDRQRQWSSVDSPAQLAERAESLVELQNRGR